MMIFLAVLACLQSDPPYIFGLHEPGGESHMADLGKKGWIVFTEEVGRDPGNLGGKDFRPWSDQGYGVIVRINHGYGPSQGTVPYAKHYDLFARRVANYVAASKGSHIWMIGNETNHEQEWPRYEGMEEKITASMYVSCFRKCRDLIKALPGRAGDQVVPQATAPWSAAVGQGWIEYHAQMLDLLGPGGLDAIAIHTYTHGTSPNLITSEAKMAPPYQDRYYNFLAYRDFMNAHPTWARTLPVYITETAQNGPWADTNGGWVRNAYGEIDAWNRTAGNQKIRALILYRWPNLDRSYLVGKNGVINDFRDAMRNDYRWTRPSAPPTPGLPDVVVTSLSYANGAFTSTVRNQGSASTPSGVSVGVGYLVDGVYRTWGAVAGPLAAGATATIGTQGGAFTIGTGTHTITAVADDVNRFVESNETNNALTTSVTVGGAPPPPSPSTGEDFETMPAWTSGHDASWGAPASWWIAGGGQSGSCLQASRGGPGSSVKVRVYAVPANTTIEVSLFMRCPSGANFWMESACRPGSWTAGDFDANAASWTMIRKFSSTGNGNVWTAYTAQVFTGSSTQLSVGFKLGSSGGSAPVVGWDTLRWSVPSSAIMGVTAEATPAEAESGSRGSCGLLGLELVIALGVLTSRRSRRSSRPRSS